MITGREFLQVADAASDGPAREPTYLGGNARYWLARLFTRNVLEYDRLDEHNDTSREQIYDAVAAFGEPVVPELRRALFRRPGQGRADALQVLSRMGSPGEAALIEAARDVRGSLRAGALAALAHGFPNCAELPTMLEVALDDDLPQVRLAAAGALWCVGQPAKPLLEKSLRHDDPLVRRAALEQVLRIDPEPAYAIPLLRKGASDSHLEVRWSAVQALFFHLPVDSAVVTAVRGLIEDGIVAAANYLPLAGPEGLTLGLSLLQDDRVSVRAAAANALANAGRAFGDGNASVLWGACRIAAQDNDLAVRLPALRVMSLAPRWPRTGLAEL